MREVSYFLWLLSMTPSALIYIWPVTVPLLIFTILAVASWFRKDRRPKLYTSKLIVSLSIALVILLYGTLLRARGANWQPQPLSWTASYVIGGLLLVQFAAGAVLLKQSQNGTRGFIGTVLIWEFLLSTSAAFISLMSVSGEWL